MITIYPARRQRAEQLAEVTSQALEALQEALQKLEANQQPTAFERATLEALQAALNSNQKEQGSLMN